MSYKPLVLVTAPVGTRSGYGSHSRDIVRSLIDMDKFDIKIWPVRWGSTPQNALDQKNPKDIPIIERLLPSPNMDRKPDVHIHIVVPNEFQPLGTYNIGITAGLETTVCPPEWVDGLNRMDLNIVPATFIKTIIEELKFDKIDKNTKQKVGVIGSEKPIEVLFEGADIDIYKPVREFSKDLVDEFEGIKEDFCFLFVGHWLQGNLGHDRKDLGMLIKTFLETFKNQTKQPALILKTSGASPSILDREDITKKVEQIKAGIEGKLPSIYFLHGDLEDEEMNDLYNHPKVKAHVSFTHGEGFGRPLLEASLSEKPVIAPNWSGHTDFLSQKDAVLLPGSLNDVKKESFPKGMWIEGTKWFTVNYNYASKTMKDVFENYNKYIVKGKKLSIMNQSKFSLDKMTEKFEGILDKHLPKFVEQPKSVDLKLPKLKKVGKPKKIELPKLKKVN
tara:strand:+ start:3529 stop:4866 length:1338 start_codon:yes stop_codon:yes gene_type:complete